MIQSMPGAAASGPFSLRVWTPDDQQHGDSRDLLGRLTLRQAYEQHVLPYLTTDKKSPGTLEAYTNALGHWERLMPTNPTLEEIDDQLLELFRSKADQAPTTCNKWFRHIRAILSRMGPRTHDRRTRRNQRYFFEVPFLDDLQEADPDPIELPDSAIDAMYRECHVATWPPEKRTGVTPAKWWQTSLVYMINYGPRRDDWLWLPWSKLKLADKEFSYVAKKTGKTHHLVANTALLAHLHDWPRLTEHVFSPTQSHRQLYREFHRIQAAAGVTRPDGLPVGFHDLRQTAAARYHGFALGTAEMLLGHSLRGQAVTKTHYLGKQYLKPLWQAIRTIPQPASFLPVIEQYQTALKRDPQRRFF